jgi:hypothetical protein
MNKERHLSSPIGERLAVEAGRYLRVVDALATLAADPHAQARARAAHQRSHENTRPGPRKRLR